MFIKLALDDINYLAIDTVNLGIFKRFRDFLTPSSSKLPGQPGTSRPDHSSKRGRLRKWISKTTSGTHSLISSLRTQWVTLS